LGPKFAASRAPRLSGPRPVYSAHTKENLRVRRGPENIGYKMCPIIKCVIRQRVGWFLHSRRKLIRRFQKKTAEQPKATPLVERSL
jgi:hypothetical protein